MMLLVRSVGSIMIFEGDEESISIEAHNYGVSWCRDVEHIKKISKESA